MKEQYDHMSHKQVHGGYAGVVSYMVDNPNANPWSGYRYGEQVGYFLEGYLRMFETTRDKAYLIRFINLALKAMAWRNSDFYFTGETAGDDQVPYMNGVLLWPMAHFVHLVLAEEEELAMEVLPDGLIAYQASTVPANVLPYSAFHTYSSLATWFMYRCVESLDAVLTDHWSSESGLCHGERICAVNMQSGFAGALLYLGHLGTVSSTYSGLLSYLDKGAVLATLFSGDEPDDRCNCIEGGPVLIPFSNNSIWWHHKALSYFSRPCFYICWGDAGFAPAEVNMDGHHEFVEDISHGVIDLVIPTLSHRFGLYTNGSYPFEEVDLVRFRNAFTTHVAHWNGTGWQFKNAVDGSNGPVSSCSGCSPYPAEHTFRYAALGWMPLHVFDESPDASSGPELYDIVSEFYADEVFSDPAQISGGLYHYGVAEVVAAQWLHECFDLTLYNRELIYDQDFTAKDVLTLDAYGEAGASFADPVIIEPRFTVGPGVTSHQRAGGAVVWQPGFEALPGSVVEAVIDPLGCDLQYRSPMLAGRTATVISETDRTNDASSELTAPVGAAPSIEKGVLSELAWMPGREGSTAGLRLTLTGEAHVVVSLVDRLGRRMAEVDAGHRSAGPHVISLPGLGWSPGLYVAVVRVDGHPHTMKLVLE